MATKPVSKPTPIAAPKAARKPSIPTGELVLMTAPHGETGDQKTIRLAALRSLRLVRLADKRVPKALKAISAIGNLATYRPTDEEVSVIMDTVHQVCAMTEARLRGQSKAVATFSLRHHQS